MPGVIILNPAPVFQDPNQQAVQSNATITATGSQIFTGYGVTEVTLFINVTASPTGTTPTLQFTLQEVDPGDGTTVLGSTVSSTSINAIGIQRITLTTFGGSIKVSWTVGGSSPSFTGVYTTLLGKAGTIKLVDSTGAAISSSNPLRVDPTNTTPQTVNGTVTVTQGTAANLNATVVGLGVAGTPSGGVLSVQGVSGGQPIPISGSISATNPSVSTNAAAAPSSSTQVGGSDGTDLQAVRVFDGDSGGGTQYVLGAILRKSASGGSVEAGTSSDPLRIDPTGTTTQPVSGTVTANIGTSGSLALDATLTGNNQRTRITDGTNLAAVKAASTAAVAADPALVVVISPNNAVAATQSGSWTTTVTQATAANLNAAVVGTGTAGTPAGGVLSIQGTVGGQAVPVSGTVAVSSVGGTVDVSDRAARLVGVVYGSQGQQIRQTATNFNTQVEVAVGGTLVDPRAIRALTSSDVVTAAQGTAAALSGRWPVTHTDGTNSMPTGDAAARGIFHRVTDGTNSAAVKAASTAPVAGDPALVVSISPNSSVTGTFTNASIGANNAAIPTSSTQVGGSDGTNLQVVRVFDADSGGGTQYVLGAILRKAASGGSVEAGTATDPLRVDPTGTTIQPVSGTVTANIGTSGSLALDATLTGNNQRTRITDGTNLAAVKAASTAAVAADPALVVAISPNNTIAATQSGSWTTTVTQATAANLNATVVQGTAAALSGRWPVIVTDGTNSMPTGDAAARGIFHRITDGTNSAAVKAASTAAVAGDPALVVAISPNNTVAATQSGTWTVAQGTAAALSGRWPVIVTDGTNTLPTGDAAARGIYHRVTDGTNTAAVKAASTAPVAADPALVVVLSPNQAAIPVTTSPSGSVPNLIFGDVSLSATGVTAVIRRTAYTEQAANFTGSIVSGSANDTAAGTGARTVRIKWVDSTGVTTGTETVTLNGTTNVNLVTSTKCFIEEMEVVTTGSGGTNAGIITLRSGLAGGGTIIGTIAVGDNRTFWCHHYVLSGKTCNVTGILHSNSTTVSGGTSTAVLRMQALPTANQAEIQISDTMSVAGAANPFVRAYGSTIQAVGPCRLTMYTTPGAAATASYRGSFDSYDL